MMMTVLMIILNDTDFNKDDKVAGGIKSVV